MASKSYLTPKNVAKSAEKGLDLREKFHKGGTHVGKHQAERLKQQDEMSDYDVKKMYSYFARHEADKKAKDFNNKENPSKGFISWLLWGGDEGKKWVDGIHDKKEKK